MLSYIKHRADSRAGGIHEHGVSGNEIAGNALVSARMRAEDEPYAWIIENRLISNKRTGPSIYFQRNVTDQTHSSAKSAKARARR